MKTTTSFIPMLTIGKQVTDLSFYERAFAATEDFCYRNDDGSVHMAQFDIDGAKLHLHEQMPGSGAYSPLMQQGVTAVVGFMADDVHAIFDRAVASGAKVISHVKDYDYGWRQGEIEDPFGHRWIIQKMLNS